MTRRASERFLGQPGVLILLLAGDCFWSIPPFHSVQPAMTTYRLWLVRTVRLRTQLSEFGQVPSKSSVTVC